VAGLTRAPAIARAAGLVVLGVLALAILRRGLAPSYGAGPLAGVLSLVHMVDLVFHEAGHVIFGLFGRFLGALGGSLNQVLIPAGCTGYFLWHRQPAAAAVALFWAGESILDVAVYVADGRDMKLPLLAEGLTHDWNWILSELSLREQAEPIGRVVFLLGALVLLAAVALLALDLVAVVSSAATPDRKPR
jgi:hypothetical protein